MSSQNTCSNCQTTFYSYSEETLCCECLSQSLETSKVPESIFRVRDSLVLCTPVKAHPHLTLKKVGTPRVLFPEVRIVKNCTTEYGNTWAMVRGVCDTCRTCCGTDYLAAPCINGHFETLRQLTSDYENDLFSCDSVRKYCDIPENRLEDLKTLLDTKGFVYTIVDANDEAPPKVDPTQVVLDIIDRIPDTRPENCKCASYEICKCKAEKDAISLEDSEKYIILGTIDKDLTLTIGRELRSLGFSIILDFVEILKKDGYSPETVMTVERDRSGEIWLEWCSPSQCLVNVSSCRTGQELYEEVRELVLVCENVSENLAQLQNTVDPETNPKWVDSGAPKKCLNCKRLEDPKSCPRLVYKGQSRQRKCGNSTYMWGICYRHYHIKYPFLSN